MNRFFSIAVIFLVLSSGSVWASQLLTIDSVKIGNPGGKFAILVPIESATETHVVENPRQYMIYFRNSIILNSGDTYEVGNGGVKEVLLKQVKPGVVMMQVSLEENHIVKGGRFDEKRKGYIFFTEKTAIDTPKAIKSDLEIEAEAEIASFRKTLQRKLKKSGFKRIVIDPGHGGFDPGAVGPSGLREKDVVLDIAKRVNAMINQETEMMSFLTRKDDYYIPLSARSVIANKYRADLFVSIHANANENRTANGFEIYYCSEKASSKEAERVAQRENISFEEDYGRLSKSGMVNIENIVLKAGKRKIWEDSKITCENFIDFFPPGCCDVRIRGVHSANFFVLRKAKMKAVLIEIAFISNTKEEKLLSEDSFRQRMASEIVEAIKKLN